jgi:hypothetical protein
MIESTPKFVQGVFPFKGTGYAAPFPLAEAASYTVSPDKRAQLMYFRAGNSSSELIYLLLTRDGKPMRYFAIGAKASDHVSLAVVEDISPDSKLEILIGAPEGAAGTMVLDLGIVEV